MSRTIIDLLNCTEHARVVLLGDVMLDRYVWGEVRQISPEAPVPILRVEKEDYRLGGVGSVATMLVALDMEPSLAAIVGDDLEGHLVREVLGKLRIDAEGVLADPQRADDRKAASFGRQSLALSAPHAAVGPRKHRADRRSAS